MAITGRLTTYPGAYLSEKDFAILTDASLGGQSGILTGCTPTVDGTTVTISDGWICIRGRAIQVTGGTIEVPLVSSGTATKYILAKLSIYGSGNADGVVSFFLSDSISNDTSNYNTTGGNAYLNMATLTITSTGVTAARSKELVASVKEMTDYSILIPQTYRANTHTSGQYLLTRLSPIPSWYVATDTHDTGETVYVKFINGLTLSGSQNLWLGFSDYDIKLAYYNGATITSSLNDSIPTGSVCQFIYDQSLGSTGGWALIGVDVNTNTNTFDRDCINVYTADQTEGMTVVAKDTYMSLSEYPGGSPANYQLSSIVTSSNASSTMKSTRPYTASVVDSLISSGSTSGGLSVKSTTIASGATAVGFICKATTSPPIILPKAYLVESNDSEQQIIYREVDVDMYIRTSNGNTITDMDTTTYMYFNFTLSQTYEYPVIIIIYGTITDPAM